MRPRSRDYHCPFVSARRNQGRRAPRSRLAAGTIAVLGTLALYAPAAAPAAPVAPPGFFGVDGTNPASDDFRFMARGDVGIYRAVIPFGAIKPRPGQPYNWSYPDYLVLEAARSGIDLLPILYGSPPWISRELSAPPIHSQAARDEWRQFLVAITARYGPGGNFWRLHPYQPRRPIRVWQVWNEPNSITWWGPRPNPRQYAGLLRRSERAIHSVDPAARILTAGLVAHPTNRSAISGRTYLSKLFSQRDMAGVADGVAYHPYSSSVKGVRRQLAGARKTLRRGPGARLPIWMTEVGWGTSGPRDHPLVKSPRGQDRALRETFEMVLRQRGKLGIERALWYHWSDESDDLCLWCETSGLLDSRLQPKRIFGTFRSIAVR